MNDTFLYNHIKQAIKQRKHFSKNPQQGNFAQKYCQRELKKKKLNFNPTSPINNAGNKMRSLMKNFQHVDTYVDLNQLLYSINEIRGKEKEQEKITQVHKRHRLSKILRSKNLDNQSQIGVSRFGKEKSQINAGMDRIQELKQRFRGQINDMIRRKYKQQTSEVDELVQYLQGESQMHNSLLKNNSSNYLSYLNQELQKISKDDDPSTKNFKENQMIFKQLTQTLAEPLQKEQIRKEYFRSTIINSKKQKEENQLLHKISTFLQIALENQHKLKWATKDIKKFRSTHGSFRFNKGKEERNKFFLQGIEIDKENNQIFSTSKEKISKSLSKKSSVEKSQLSIKKGDSQKVSIFRQRSIQKDEVDPIKTGNVFEDSTNRNFRGTQTKKGEKKSLFKSYGVERDDARKTEPVNTQKLSILDSSFSKDNRVESAYQKQGRLHGDSLRKSYIVKKKRKTGEYNFMGRSSDKTHYKTVIVGKKKLESSSVSYDNDLNNTLSEFDCSNNQNSFNQHESSKNQKFLKKSTSKKSMISQSFTFKKRGKKQQILKKLQSFIADLNEQQRISKLQNQYYGSAINQLDQLSKTTYKSCECEALAGFEEISELKKFVNGINSSKMRSSKKAMSKRTIR